MRASLHIGGLEFALIVPRGELEALVATSYEPYLGATVAPVGEIDLRVLDGLESPSRHHLRERTDAFTVQRVASHGVESGLLLIPGTMHVPGEVHVSVLGSARCEECEQSEAGDEVTAIRASERGWAAWSTPFGSSRLRQRPVSAPLATLNLGDEPGGPQEGRVERILEACLALAPTLLEHPRLRELAENLVEVLSVTGSTQPVTAGT